MKKPRHTELDASAKDSICAKFNCSYVGSMNWQQLLLIALVLTVAVILVWRSSGQKSHEHGCGCGCETENDTPETKPGSKNS